MAERIAILGGEQYAEWIDRSGAPQYLFRAYRNRWPGGTAECVAIGDEFYVRANDGEMRRVYDDTDFENETAWCAQCGTPLDPSSAYYDCGACGCDAILCEQCEGSSDGGCYCPRHCGNGMLREPKGAEYTPPYTFGSGKQFTFGVEVELESELDADFAADVTDSGLIAGWDCDPSLGDGGVELQTNILDMSKLPALVALIERIPDYGDAAGGHIHVARTTNQRASRWYWALHGLDASQCRLLNMRHMSDDYWCGLKHGEYTGKHTAVNDEHTDTIELRTFDCWYEGSANKLVPAVKWVRAMWRFFENHPRGVKAKTIEQYASCMADNVTDTPHRTLAERLNAARRAKAARKAEEEYNRRVRAAEIRRNVEKNVRASRVALRSHGNTSMARREWANRQNRRARNREDIGGRLSNTIYAYAFPSRNLRPLHTYLDMAAARIVERGETFRSLERFRIYHAATGESIWEGYEYWGRHGDTAQRVIENILRSRVARASHGKPTAESLERTALRLYKRAGRPELSARYARIRKGIAQANAE
jgi:hypothetical protein